MADQTPPWTDCVAHRHFDEDCEYCEAEMAGKSDYLQTLQEQTQTLNHKIMGITQIPYIESSPAIPALMVQTLVEMIFTDPKARIAYEANFTGKLVQQMEKVHSTAIQMQIKGNGRVTLSPDQAAALQRMRRG